MTNGLPHPYHLDGSTFNSKDIRSKFSFLFHFSMKSMKASRIASAGALRLGASHLGLFWLHMSHKKDAMLIWVKNKTLEYGTLSIHSVESHRIQ